MATHHLKKKPAAATPDPLAAAQLEIDAILRKHDLVGLFILQSEARFMTGIVLAARWTSFMRVAEDEQMRPRSTDAQYSATGMVLGRFLEQTRAMNVSIMERGLSYAAKAVLNLSGKIAEAKAAEKPAKKKPKAKK